MVGGDVILRSINLWSTVVPCRRPVTALWTVLLVTHRRVPQFGVRELEVVDHLHLFWRLRKHSQVMVPLD